ncbi:MAG: translation initiation factor IF-2 [Bacteroidales bacterium]|nr:translation initiation factor IF-2 [Bacteroidales bacterium]
MSEEKTIRLSKAAREFNVGASTIVEFLAKKGQNIDPSPNTKLTAEQYALVVKEYQGEKEVKKNADQLNNLIFKGKTITVGEKDRPAAVEEKEEKVITIKTNSIPADEANVPAKEEALADVKEPAKEQPAEPKTPVVEPAKETIEEPVEKTVKETVAEEKKKIVEEVKIEEKVEVEPKVEKPVSEAAQDAVKLNVVGKIELPDAKKANSEKGNGQPKNEGKKNENRQQKPAQPQKQQKPAQQKPAQPQAKQAQQQTKPVQPQQKPSQADQKAIAAQAANTDNPVNFIPTKVKKLEGPNILGKIELPSERKPKGKTSEAAGDEKTSKDKKKKRKRIGNSPVDPNEIANQEKKKGGKQQGKQQSKQQQGQGGKQQGQNGNQNKPGNDNRGKDRLKRGKQPIIEEKTELTDEEIKNQIKETLARLSPLGKSKTSKHRREKRHNIQNELEEERMHEMEEKKVLKVTEFVTANELATMMNIPVTKVIATCMSLGMFVSINQRLDAEILQVVAEEFGFSVEFTSIDVQEALAENDEPDNPEDLVPRAPVVTVMGHVDHGKTKLLDYIRSTNVVAGEAGGITQHIGAYEVRTTSGKKVTFLDTPGHEAFTAMRARGAKITDVAIIVIAADDNVMPQTIEAINHAHAANVPIVFAINKIDKPTADPQKIYRQLADMNILVEEWGGKVQSQEISAKQGIGVDELLEKVLLEAEMLDLKGNPNRLAKGSVIESALDKGRGYVAKVLVQEGTLRVGDMVLAGTTYGKVKAMFNERNQTLKEAGPSTPLLLLGLNGAPQAGDNFNVMTDEREVKTIASRRLQLQREQGIRTQKHITLDEIGRRIAIGDFKELNIIVKADVDGSVEALSDSLLKLSTEEVQVNIIHKSVGAISEADIMLASASNAVIVGFNVRPTMQARKIAEREQIDIRLYSIIYTAIEEIKSAIEGMLAPEIQEVVTCNIEIREVFHISKVGNIAGCMVLDGKVNRQTKVRVIRDGIVVHTGALGSLKRFKDDVKEVSAGFECGLNIDNFNDIKVGDIIEGYQEKEISRKL